MQLFNSSKFGGAVSLGVGGSAEIENSGTFDLNSMSVTENTAGGEFGPSIGPVGVIYGVGETNGVRYDKMSIETGVSAANIIGGKLEAKIETTRIDE